MSDTPPPQFAQYPRPSYQQTPFGRPPGVYIDAIGDAWKLVRSDLASWIGATMLSGVVAAPFYFLAIWASLTYAPNAGVLPTEDFGGFLTANLSQLAFNLPFSLMAYVLGAGMANMAVRQVYGEPISPTTVFLAFRRFPSLVGTNLLFMILMYAGFLLCIVPGLYLMGALAFAQLIAMNRNQGPVEAIRESYQTLKGHAWMMMLLLIISGIVSGIGAIACGVGLLVTIPIYHAVVGLHYTYFYPRVPAEGYAPPSGYER